MQTSLPTMQMQQFHSQQQMQMQPQYHSMNPFQMHNQHAFAPQDFHQPPPPASFQPIDSQNSNSPPVGDVNMDLGMQNGSPELLFHPDSFQQQDVSATKMQHPLMEK